MKLVLSRKGFDTGSGGCFSPYDHHSGRYIWFPIPEKKNHYSNTINYADVRIKEDYFNNPKYEAGNLSELYKRLLGHNRIKMGNSKACSIDDVGLSAHFDPMLGEPPWMERGSGLKIGKGFGQSNAAPHLLKQEVGAGSVFLFFGGFKSIHNHYSGHYFYGWMKVKERIDNYDKALQAAEEYNLGDHPHLTESAFQKLNFIYTPEEWLFEDLEVPGCGYFTALNDSLLLSRSKDRNKSEWLLPKCFYKQLTQAYKNSWVDLGDDFCTVKTGRGQEYVTELSAAGEAWLRQLFKRNADNISAADG
ncbi:hypothetical protein JSY36_08220 [Bacillus sp. H-16]|uniref:Nmad3 family putative nucleotide modification protein n=1 Tax=Alteribacter salitolerans TaxID=2912333 RepID=UPI0019629907|nr:hypothetical protein [Alteribacter salitolerans]MBM7095736.1 hypothetical protein [Alteribacter salitolerans]